MRFAPNPLSELALSTMIVRYPDRHPFHAAWYRATASGRRRVGEERILSLINEHKDIPDLLMRPAGLKTTTFDAELRRVAALPTRRWREDLDYVWPDGLPAALGRRDESVRERAVAILADYWAATMAPYWRGFKTVLDADVTYRAHQLAALGPAATLREVSDRLVVDNGDIVLHGAGSYTTRWDRGSAVTLLPTLVKWNHNIPNREHADLVVSYRARGRGRLNERPTDAVPGLVGILGRTRAQLLLSLDEPASSTAVSLFMGVTVSAANQHLRALAAGGLLHTSRFGRYVLYARSPVAEDLIEACARVV